MSSNIRIEKVCNFCEDTFVAKTLTTRYCSRACNKKDYRNQKRLDKVQKNNEQVVTKGVDVSLFELISSKDYLNIREASELIGVSERTFYRLIKNGTIEPYKLGSRTIIKRSSIDKIFE